jgi:hypothetical protein
MAWPEMQGGTGAVIFATVDRSSISETGFDFYLSGAPPDDTMVLAFAINPAIVNFGGPPGPAGPIGLTGPSGASGATGNQGVQGLTGASGGSGSPGPGFAFFGAYNSVGIYYDNANLVAVVSYMGSFYFANNPAKNGQAIWGLPTGSDWTLIGTQFSAIATGLLLTQNAVITVSLVLGQSGTNIGYIQSANYVAGVSGFYIDATGYAEFNDLLIRGNLSVTSAIFNAASPGNLFPATSFQSYEDTTVRTSLGSGGTIIPFLTFNGWSTGSAGFTNNRYGQANVAFLVTASGGYTVVSGDGAQTDVVYSLDGGTTWNQTNVNSYGSSDADGGFNFPASALITGLTATGSVIFALRCSAGNNATSYNSAKVSVLAFNF